MSEQNSKISCTKLEESVEIFSHPLDREEAVTIPQFLQEISLNYGDCVAFSYKDRKSNKLITKTYRQFYDHVLMVAKYFLSLELSRYGVMAIFAENSFEWFLAEFAAIFDG